LTGPGSIPAGTCFFFGQDLARNDWYLCHEGKIGRYSRKSSREKVIVKRPCQDSPYAYFPDGYVQREERIGQLLKSGIEHSSREFQVGWVFYQGLILPLSMMPGITDLQKTRRSWEMKRERHPGLFFQRRQKLEDEARIMYMSRVLTASVEHDKIRSSASALAMHTRWSSPPLN
jgi:hypothetical protein